MDASSYAGKVSSTWVRERQKIYREAMMKAQVNGKNDKEQPILNQRRVKWWRLIKFPRLVFIIFHPAVIALAIMIGLLSFKLNQILTSGSKAAARPKGPSLFNSPSALPTEEVKLKNSSSKLQVPDSPPGTSSLQTRSHARSKRNLFPPSPDDTDYSLVFRYSKRPVPETALDDMLLDAEMSLPNYECLKQNSEHFLDLKEEYELHIQRKNGTLQELHGECEIDGDCLQLSPYIWKAEGTGEPCRKKTFLRCNRTAHKCQCLDKLDIKWNTYASQKMYQWNPITKTCYVRGTNPCKEEIPCAPGTTCRTTVSISYNTPPMQRICECSDIDQVIFAGNKDWWYCKHYWQRAWYYDLDNINRWPQRTYHMYTKMTDEKIFQGVEEENEVLDPPSNMDSR